MIDIWANEATDFTPWLAQHIGLLGDKLNMALEVLSTEAEANGRFVDILAEERDFGRVVIENQLTRSDDSHLSRLLIYAAGHDAKVLIWIAPSFGDDYRAALEWLNRWLADDVQVYGVEVVAWKIGDSLSAPDFRPVVVPNAWSNQAKRTTGNSALSNSAFNDYYRPLVTRLREEAGFDYMGRAGWRTKWRSFRTGYNRIVYALQIGDDEQAGAWVYLQIDANNYETIFARLEEKQREMAEEFSNGGLAFYGGKNIGVSMNSHVSIDNPDIDIETVRAWMYDNLVKLRTVVQPRLDTLMEELDPEEVIE